MSGTKGFFICAVCFMASETKVICHDHWMIFCDAMDPQDERRKPEISARGRIKSRAPRWFLEAVRNHEPPMGGAIPL